VNDVAKVLKRNTKNGPGVSLLSTKPYRQIQYKTFFSIVIRPFAIDYVYSADLLAIPSFCLYSFIIGLIMTYIRGRN